jgi:hypothetical protein
MWIIKFSVNHDLTNPPQNFLIFALARVDVYKMTRSLEVLELGLCVEMCLFRVFDENTLPYTGHGTTFLL